MSFGCVSLENNVVEDLAGSVVIPVTDVGQAFFFLLDRQAGQVGEDLVGR